MYDSRCRRAGDRVWDPAWTTLIVFYAVSGLACLLSGIFPLTPAAPVTLNYAIAAWGGVGTILMLLLHGRAPSGILHLFVLASTILGSVGVANSATLGGAMASTFGQLCLGAYVGYFHGRRTLLAHLAVTTTGVIVAGTLNPLPGYVHCMAIGLATLWGVSLTLNRLATQLRYQLNHDLLTGVLNRQGYTTEVQRLTELASRKGTPLTMAVLDLDGFKQINDTLGHAAGDRLLAGLGMGWRQQIRRSDQLARTGGDEFVLLLPDTTLEQAGNVARRLEVPGVSWSTGIAQWEPGERVEAWMDRADQALYRDKEAREAAGLRTGR